MTAADFGLGTQGWAGLGPLDDRSLRPASSPIPRPKPYDGFFTSTWDSSRCTTAWLDYMRSEGNRPTQGRSLWLLEPDADARLYVIDTLDDFKTLADRFPQSYDNPNNPWYAPNWSRVFDEGRSMFDAIHVTFATVDAGKSVPGTEHPVFFGWDVESTLWLSAKFTDCGCFGALGDDWTISGYEQQGRVPQCHSS